MRVLVIENSAGTHLGLVEPALAERGAAIDTRIAHRGEAIPDTPGVYDALIVLGGAQSALDDEDHPYLPAVARLTREFGRADKAVLGICLGAQLVARGHGAENILGGPIEFGWHDIRPTAEGARDPVLAAIAGGTPVFHWHNDTFTLPPGATHLATSAMTRNQAFRLGRAVYGIQFHVEVDRELAARWTSRIRRRDRRVRARLARVLPVESARHGARADAAGLAIARAWVGLIA